MSSFTEATWEPVMVPHPQKGLVQKKRDGRDVYRVKGRNGDGFWFYIGDPKDNYGVHVSEGFETDLLSIPTVHSPGWLKLMGLITWVIPRWARERAVKSGALHDVMREDPRFTTADADGHFWIAMSAEGTPETWRWVFFQAVITNGSKKVYQG